MELMVLATRLDNELTSWEMQKTWLSLRLLNPIDLNMISSPKLCSTGGEA